jgi:sec-independent protein translocase protein TatA
MNPIALLAWTPSAPDMIILLVLGVLLFGRRLPEIGRYLGKGIVEFKKGLKGMEDEVEGTSSGSAAPPRQEPALDQPRPPQRVTASTPKFEDAAPKFEDTRITTPPAKFEDAPAKFEEKPANSAPPPQV